MKSLFYTKNNDDVAININPYPTNEFTSKGKILVVDDSKYILDAMRNLIKNIMSKAKCDLEIITGSDGVDIIKNVIDDQAKGNLIKCIITDENMEYINGTEAIRLLRSLEKQNKIRHFTIISATSEEDVQSINYIKEAGADLVMSKPLSRHALIKVFQDFQIIPI